MTDRDQTVIVEELAQVLHQNAGMWGDWSNVQEGEKAHWRKQAATAIAFLRPQPADRGDWSQELVRMIERYGRMRSSSAKANELFLQIRLHIDALPDQPPMVEKTYRGGCAADEEYLSTLESEWLVDLLEDSGKYPEGYPEHTRRNARIEVDRRLSARTHPTAPVLPTRSQLRKIRIEYSVGIGGYGDFGTSTREFGLGEINALIAAGYATEDPDPADPTAEPEWVNMTLKLRQRTPEEREFYMLAKYAELERRVRDLEAVRAATTGR